MKISTKGIYAIDAMVDLATHSRDDNIESIKDIAIRRKLSEKYLEQIVGALRRAGLIISIRGAGGGYKLAKATDQITILQILQAVENNLIPIECLYKKTDCGIDCDRCASRGFWNNMWRQIEQVVENVTLDDIIKEVDLYEKTAEIEYYI